MYVYWNVVPWSIQAFFPNNSPLPAPTHTPTTVTEHAQLSKKRSCFASFISVLLISRGSDGSLTDLMIGDDKLRTLSRSPIRTVASLDVINLILHCPHLPPPCMHARTRARAHTQTFLPFLCLFMYSIHVWNVSCYFIYLFIFKQRLFISSALVISGKDQAQGFVCTVQNQTRPNRLLLKERKLEHQTVPLYSCELLFLYLEMISVTFTVTQATTNVLFQFYVWCVCARHVFLMQLNHRLMTLTLVIISYSVTLSQSRRIFQPCWFLRNTYHQHGVQRG